MGIFFLLRGRKPSPDKVLDLYGRMVSELETHFAFERTEDRFKVSEDCADLPVKEFSTFEKDGVKEALKNLEGGCVSVDGVIKVMRPGSEEDRDRMLVDVTATFGPLREMYGDVCVNFYDTENGSWADYFLQDRTGSGENFNMMGAVGNGICQDFEIEVSYFGKHHIYADKAAKALRSNAPSDRRP